MESSLVPVKRLVIGSTVIALVLLAIYVFYQHRRTGVLPYGTYGNASCPVMAISIIGSGEVGGITQQCAATAVYACGDLAGSTHDCPRLVDTGTGAGCVDTGTTTLCKDDQGRILNITQTAPPFAGLTPSSTLVLSDSGTSFEMPNITTAGTFGGPGIFWTFTRDAQGRNTFAQNSADIGLTFGTSFSGDVTGSNATLFLKSRGLGANYTIGSSNCIPILSFTDGGVLSQPGACASFVISELGNGTIIMGDPSGIVVTDLGNGTIIISPIQPITTTATPTFAGLTLNNGNLRYIVPSTLPPGSYNSQVLNGIYLSGLDVTGGPFGDAVNTIYTPAIQWYNGIDTYPHMGAQSRNSDDAGLYWDMAPSTVFSATPFAHFEFAWTGSVAGVNGMALWKSGNTLNVVAGAAPGAPGNIVGTATIVQFGLSNVNVLVPLTLATPLYVTSGGTGSATAMTGNKFIVGVAGANGGSMVEDPNGAFNSGAMAVSRVSDSANVSIAQYVYQRIGHTASVTINILTLSTLALDQLRIANFLPAGLLPSGTVQVTFSGTSSGNNLMCYASMATNGDITIGSLVLVVGGTIRQSQISGTPLDLDQIDFHYVLP